VDVDLFGSIEEARRSINRQSIAILPSCHHPNKQRAAASQEVIIPCLAQSISQTYQQSSETLIK